MLKGVQIWLLHFDIYIVLVHPQLQVAVAWTCTQRDGHTHRAESPTWKQHINEKNQDIRRAKKKLTSLGNMTYDSEGKYIVLYMSIRLTDFTANIFQTFSVLEGKEKEKKNKHTNKLTNQTNLNNLLST